MKSSLQAKTTIVPIEFDMLSFTRDVLPITIAKNVTAESVEGVLKSEDFEIWEEFVSKKNREELAAVKVGLVDRFMSPGHMGEEEKSSQDLLQHCFLCLRLIKPTRSSFCAIQFKHHNRGIDVFNVVHPDAIPLSLPDAEVLNKVTPADLTMLREVLPQFMRLFPGGPVYVRRAARLCEIGYSEIRDASIQFLTWMMGIEAFLSEAKVIPQKELVTAAERWVNLDEFIYNNSPEQEFLSLPRVTLRQLFDDLLVLRNELIHGRYIPEEWKSRVGRPGITQNQLPYVEMVREAASFLLRRLILAFLTKGDNRPSR